MKNRVDIMQTDLFSFYQGHRGGWKHIKGCINEELTTIDLFAGAGGFSCGMSEAGFNIIAAVEFEKGCCMTLRKNRHHAFPNMKVIEEDITKLKSKTLMDISGIKKGELYMLIGGPPCQGFSMNNINRSINDPRSKLMFEYIRVLRDLQPKQFMMENVPGLLSFKDFFYELLSQFEDCGYIVRFIKVDCASYGIPQHRVRILVHGIRQDFNVIPEYPPPTNFDPEALKCPENGISQADIAVECFAKNGFKKEDVYDVWWNKKLNIMMNKKTAADDVNNACNKIILENLMGCIK